MTQNMVDIRPETQQHILAMLASHPGMTFGQLAGKLLDAQVAYRLEVERMKPEPLRPIVFNPTEYTQDDEYSHDFPSGGGY